MTSAKKDSSDIFKSATLQFGAKKAAIYDDSVQISPSGLTFKTNTSLPTWTEVDMELRLPKEKGSKVRATGAQKIGCRGVVVHCKKESKGDAYNVALLFCGVTPRNQQKLRAASKKQSLPSV